MIDNVVDEETFKLQTNHNNPLDDQKRGRRLRVSKEQSQKPKIYSGETWQLNFQSSGDLKKHGNTEKSKVNEVT